MDTNKNKKLHIPNINFADQSHFWPNVKSSCFHWSVNQQLSIFRSCSEKKVGLCSSIGNFIDPKTPVSAQNNHSLRNTFKSLLFSTNPQQSGLSMVCFCFSSM